MGIRSGKMIEQDIEQNAENNFGIDPNHFEKGIEDPQFKFEWMAAYIAKAPVVTDEQIENYLKLAHEAFESPIPGSFYPEVPKSQ